jgi:hypothetical protein
LTEFGDGTVRWAAPYRSRAGLRERRRADHAGTVPDDEEPSPERVIDVARARVGPGATGSGARR